MERYVIQVTVTVSKEGEGAVTPGTGVYPKDVPKTFTATPATGWRWSHWEGSLGGNSTDASLTLPMTTGGTLKAVFIERVTLTMAKDLTGNLPAEGGTVSPGVGQHTYDRGTVVNLTATAASGRRSAAGGVALQELEWRQDGHKRGDDHHHER